MLKSSPSNGPDWVDNNVTESQFYSQYIGTYATDFQGIKEAEFEILIQNEGLALRIPGQPVFELNDPDGEGYWIFKLTDLISITFEKNDSQEVESLTLSQATPFQKTVNDMKSENDTTSILQKYSGSYIMPSMKIEIIVAIENGNLTIRVGEGEPDLLSYDESSGQWLFKSGISKRLKFIVDKKGEVMALNIIDLLEIPRCSIQTSEGS